MDDIGDIGFVDPHAEGVGGDHDLPAVIEKIVLVLRPLFVRKTCVIAGGVIAPPDQHVAGGLDFLPGPAVDDAAVPDVAVEKTEQMELFAAGCDVKIQVRTVEAVDVDQRIPEPEGADDVLADKELFETICKTLDENGLHRDQDNPDVVFTLIKDANQSIDYTYVPETREQVQTGSTSTPIYGYKGAYLGSVTKNKYETVTSGGYTQKTASTQAYLEVNFMETKRLGEKTLPLIWQLKYTYHEQSEANIDKLYESAVTWVDWPIRNEAQEKTSNTCTRFFFGDIPLYDFGIVLDADAVVIGLDKYSDVVKKSGLRIGDRIRSIDVKQGRSLGKSRGTHYSGTIKVERNGSSTALSFSKCKRTKFFGKMTFASARATF